VSTVRPAAVRRGQLAARLALVLAAIGLLLAGCGAAGNGSAATSTSTTAVTSTVGPTTTPATSAPTTTVGPTSTTGASFAASADDLCAAYVPRMEALLQGPGDPAVANAPQIRQLAAEMLSRISALAPPPGLGPVVTDWITAWENIWTAVTSGEDPTSFSAIAESDAKQLDLGPACM
jgi:hypothetical protein